jgi:serine/threonine protein kinase
MAAGFDPIRRLGSGAFGEVWLAREEALGADYAVKLIRRDCILSTDSFFEEARILKELEHDHIVRVVEAGWMPDQSIYISMQYEPRGSAADEAGGAPMPMCRAVSLLCDALRGLEHAHHKGIVHCDIKPANILVGAKGEGKLSDFGLARHMKAGGAMPPVFYLPHKAPEVAAGAEASVSSDIYAAGVTLYRLLNGDEYLPNFDGQLACEQAIVRGSFPDRKRYRLFVPGALRTTVNRAMHVDPNKRYGSAHELRSALEQTTIRCDWQEVGTAGATAWTTTLDGTELEVRMVQSQPNVFDVETRKRRLGTRLRRVRAECANGLDARKASRFVQGVLTRYASGKRE